MFLQQALEERSTLQSLNAQLQHKLAEYFKKKKVYLWKNVIERSYIRKFQAKFES